MPTEREAEETEAMMMRTVWKTVLIVVALATLAIITLPLWRYQLWMYEGAVIRYDRLTGKVSYSKGGGFWEK
jgi:hypothetical protein